jgi:hypothetical protein
VRGLHSSVPAEGVHDLGPERKELGAGDRSTETSAARPIVRPSERGERIAFESGPGFANSSRGEQRAPVVVE